MRHAFIDRLERTDLAPAFGRVRMVSGGFVEASGPAAGLGDLCKIDGGAAGWAAAEVAAVDERRVVLIPLEKDARIRLGARVVADGQGRRVPVGEAYAGRAVDALGRAIDGGTAIAAVETLPLDGSVPRPFDRTDPASVLATGLRVVDGLLTLGVGQRVGIFAASGVGKTSLIEQLATQVDADRCILCLVGERGREVEALWRLLSSRADAERFTLVAATSDESAAMRVRSVQYALTLADHWRAEGEHVIVMVDSITRMAMALREIGLAAEAPPTVRAYTPNVFAALPRVVERCGALRGGGATTAVMTILSETDDVDDPIVELMKSLLDGHVVLSRALAEHGHFPAIDATRSISRQSDRLVTAEHAAATREAVAMLAAYEEARVMIESGVYRAGTNAGVDRAIAARAELTGFLRQGRCDSVPLVETVARLRRVTGTDGAHD